MKAATLSEIKKELNTLPPEQLVELCLRLSKYKKENKEFEGFKFIVSSYKYSEYLKLIN